ncbi:hypothetical protein EW145_g6842 [Phellinidium pouzarii]|uniref:Fungal-type protein kinase domain-containing protein n=1 Tax=Phellinidium pouzarii TaxID=167371 RepID=A0A4S4KTS9_9AGAM|nr:hypothetical protein EW145_g6842 [Phellinidium pouzarii]
MLDSLSVEQRTRSSSAEHAGARADGSVALVGTQPDSEPRLPHLPYRLYKMRYVGVVGIVALNVVAGMNLPWFGPIANGTSDAFGISLDEVNWLGNIVGVTYLVVAPLVPIVCSRYEANPNLTMSIPPTQFLIGTLFLIASAWVRFAGTTHSLSPRGAYALLIIGQVLVLGIISTAVSPFVLLIVSKPPTPPYGIAYSGSQPSPHFLTTLRAIFGLLPRPAYDGEGVGTLLSEVPFCTSPPLIVTSASHKAENDEQRLGLESSITSTLKKSAQDEQVDTQAWETNGDTENTTPCRASGNQVRRGRDFKFERTLDGYMTLRERIDFAILSIVFGVLLAGVNTFSLLSNEILEPYGYSEDTAGFMGAALLLSGLAAAFITAPLFDRIFTHHLGRAVRIFSPPIAAAWLALIWAARENNAVALYALLILIGVCSLSTLPVALELGCELTRNSEASSAILWFSGNLCGIIFILVMSALRAPASASPPLNMHRALVFNGVTIFATTMSIFLFRGRQRRRERDVSAATAATAADLEGSVNGGTDVSMSLGASEKESERGADCGRSQSYFFRSSSSSSSAAPFSYFVDPHTTISKEFNAFLRTMLGENQHLVDRRDPILHSIATSAKTRTLRKRYCETAKHKSVRYGRFCQLVNHIIAQLPGTARRHSFVFCRNESQSSESVFDDYRQPDVVVLGGNHPSVVDGRWKAYTGGEEGPRRLDDVPWTWHDIQHVFEFKLVKKRILYEDEEAEAALRKLRRRTKGAHGKPLSTARKQPTSAATKPPPSAGKPMEKRRNENEGEGAAGRSKRRRKDADTLFDVPDKGLWKHSTRYAIDRMALAPNVRHAISGLVQDGDLWMCYYDHGGIVCSSRFTFVSDLYRFVLLIKALVGLSPSDRGTIKGFKKYDPEDFDDVYIDLTRASSPEYSSDGSRPLVDMHRDPPAGNKVSGSLQGSRIPDHDRPRENSEDSPKWFFSVGPHDFLVRYPLSKGRHYNLTGRASRVNAATCGTLDPSDPSRVYALKTNWPVDRRHNEAGIIKLARNVLDGLDKVKGFKEKHEISGRLLSDCLPRVYLSEDLEDFGDKGFRSRIGSFLQDRIFRIIAFDQLHPLYMVENVDVLKQLFREIFQGHHFLSICQETILHHDISIGNLMYRKMPDGTLRGVLNDWDLAKVGNSADALKGAGTCRFMARDLLVKNPPDHLERFDWESMFYVLYWIACRYENGRCVNHGALERWSSNDADVLRATKNFIFSDLELKMVTKHFWPFVCTWLDPFRELFSGGYLARTDCSNRICMTGVQEEFDDTSLGGHVTYDKLWAILRN